MCSRFLSLTFLQGQQEDMHAKQEAIMSAVVPLQMEVAATAGFPDDTGFLKMQCLMLQHSSDDQISYNTLSGLMPVYRRAGISLQSGAT